MCPVVNEKNGAWIKIQTGNLALEVTSTGKATGVRSREDLPGSEDHGCRGHEYCEGKNQVLKGQQGLIRM